VTSRLLARRGCRIRRWLLVATVAALALGVATACGGGAAAGATVDLATLPDQIVARYRFVEANQELAEQLPCYCGCGQSLDHRSLRDCFVRDGGEYDAHAAGCGVCQLEADDAEQLLAGGETPAAIRATIDERYGGLGTPTDTPPTGGS
jgi:Protein of unknown function with PCYCGC motif